MCTMVFDPNPSVKNSTHDEPIRGPHVRFTDIRVITQVRYAVRDPTRMVRHSAAEMQPIWRGEALPGCGSVTDP